MDAAYWKRQQVLEECHLSITEYSSGPRNHDVYYGTFSCCYYYLRHIRNSLDMRLIIVKPWRTVVCNTGGDLLTMFRMRPVSSDGFDVSLRED